MVLMVQLQEIAHLSGGGQHLPLALLQHQALTLQLNASVKHVSPSPLGKARFFGIEFIAPSTQNFLALYYITQSASE